MQDYTTEALLQHLYKESSTTTFAAIEKEFLTNWQLKEKFDLLSALTRELDNIMECPRSESVSAILEYARASAELV